MITIIVGVLLLLIFLYGWWIEPTLLTCTKRCITLDASLLQVPIRILFLSDLHIGFWFGRSSLKRLVRTVERAHAEHSVDLILLGGDYLDRSIRYLPLFNAFLAELTALSIPTYAVIGNHDHHYHSVTGEKIGEALKAAGVELLVNDARLLKCNTQEVVLVGLQDLEASTSYPVARSASRKARQQGAQQTKWYQQFDSFYPNHVRILLSHNPDAFFLPGQIRPQLLFAGHTHGGQWVPLAWLGKVATPVLARSSFLAWAGYQVKDGVHLVISRGIGGSGIPLRILRRPELLEVTLQPGDISPRIKQ